MTLRELFINWLTGSRFILSLEARLTEQRQDFTQRLAEKDHRIRQLETEAAGLKLECDRMRLVLLPLGSPAGQMYAQRFNQEYRPPGPPVPEFDGPLDWQAELQQLIKQEEGDGVHGDGRVQVNQSGTNDVARAQSEA